ncbi:transferrin-binding protein-like solute binding protein [Psychrobacter sp. AOP3-A1-26]|uniref:transferrin-binding protein-like solute binding protein n=1 Tax=Psychrobacter sp. AOP3-A1-26 TaxID=3457700 RepID=UPI004034F815
MVLLLKQKKTIKAAEEKTKAAEEALKVAEAKTKVAEAALKAAEAGFGKESEKAAEASRKAIDAAKEEAAKAKTAAEAARVEAVTKIEAAAKASKTKVDAAKKTAADAVAKVKAAEEKAKAADNRATVAETKAKEVEASLKAEIAAKKAAQVKTKAAEAETKKAQANAKTAEEKAAKAVKDAKAARTEADKKVADIEKASASQIAEAKKAAKDAQDALETAEAKAITAAKVAAKAAADAADAALKEAAAKLDAVKTASATQIDAAKKEAADAQARAEKAEEDAAAAQTRIEAAEATAKLEAEKAEEALLAKQNAEQAATAAQAQAEKKKAEKAQAEANKAKGELTTAQEELAAAEKALADALASGGGNTEALQAEVDRRQAALDTANAKIIATEQAQADAAAAAEAQLAAANQATQAAKDALAAAQINNAPETKKSGVQSLSIDPSAAGLPNAFTATTRDFNATDNSVEARADTASSDLLPIVNVTTSGADDTNLQDGFKSHDDSTEITTALGVLPLNYNSTYKDFGDDMRIGHIDGAAALGDNQLPVNGVAVVGNATQAANMPTDGKVGYTGDATHRQLGIGNDIEFGKSVFTADFVAQNVKGDLTFDKAGKIGLTAGINGNQFSGTADDNAGYNTEGGFFGGDGQYLGGVYEGNGAQGTYGAKSDKQTAAEQAAADAQTDADNAQAAIADANAQAAAAQAAADKAKADAIKAQAALAAAEDALANAGTGDGGLAAALARAEAAEVAEAAALQAAETAEAARAAAQAAQVAAEESALKAKAAADKAVGDAKVEADKKVAEANQQAADAKTRADKAETDATTAKAAEAKAKAEAATTKAEAAEAVAAANAKADKANQQATAAQAQAQAEKKKAEKAQAEANKAKGELTTAQEELAAAEKALADALASGGGNTEALQAEVDRRQAALDTANAKIIATKQAQADAAAAAEAQLAAANQATQAAKDALAAAQINNAPETKKSGAQSINVGTTAAGLPSDFIVTTRDFEIGENNVIARADVASGDLLPKVDVNISGAGDTELANGFKSHDDSTSITTALGELPLTYTSVYKDYGDDMRIAHIDGAAELQGTEIPVDGVAVVGSATQAANMPTDGKVGYTGDATHRQLGIGNDIEFGKSVFTADFVAQNVKGDLTFDKAGKIGLTAGINGNQFSGTADDNAGYNTEGGFFGGDGQYLGGVYEGNGAQGTYGAKSDKQTAAEQAAADAQTDADNAQAAIADANAQAAAAQAAADKAKADAIKAQAALAAAEDALANAGTGDGGLAAALARAEAAEVAEAAALQAAETAEAARAAAETAQTAAEDAAIKAQAAADKAIGDAKVEADKKVAEANQQAADAKAQAAKAQTDADEAETAKLEAEARAKAAEDALAAAEELPPAPTNPQAPVNATISGFQNTISGDDNSAINTNTSDNYDKLKVNILETGSGRYDDNTTTDFALRNEADLDYEGGFKKSSLYSLPAGYLNRRFKYTSTYKNYEDQMQIGHIHGDLKTTNNGARLDLISNVYVQGNSTDNADMQYMKDLSQYNVDNGINDGKVSYKGDASYIGNSKDEIIGHDPIIGTSEFSVDFVDSQVDGTLLFEGTGVSEKTIKAEINGNSFAGNWNGVDTKGGFFGEDAGLLGGVYQVSGGKGTYGATKVDPEAAPDPTESRMTGFQSTALSSKEKTLPLGLGQLDNAIGYVDIRDDKSDWTELKTENGSEVPVDNGKGNNFNSFKNGVVRADMVKPDSVLKPIAVSLTDNGSVKVDAGKGGQNPTFNYNAVYKNFDSQMQVGHVYGNFNSLVGDVSRAANVYVEGYLTSQAGMDNLKNVNDGTAQYHGMATYIENIHLDDNASTAPENGTSAFNVDFVNGSVDGTLAFDDGDYKYMPAGNEIKIDADITGNTFAGNKNGIDTAGGFYGEDAQFLGGIYQDAADQGGKGTVAGTGTKFQGTFGAEKQ